MVTPVTKLPSARRKASLSKAGVGGADASMSWEWGMQTIHVRPNPLDTTPGRGLGPTGPVVCSTHLRDGVQGQSPWPSFP